MGKYTKPYNSFWKDLLYNVRGMIRRPNKWATNQIPYGFKEYDHIIEDICFSALIDFWENDGGEETLRYQCDYYREECKANPEDQFSNSRLGRAEDIYNTLAAAYHWALVRDNEYKRIYSLKVKDWEKTEAEWAAKDNKYLEDIIKYRKHLWV